MPGMLSAWASCGCARLLGPMCASMHAYVYVCVCARACVDGCLLAYGSAPFGSPLTP